MKKNASFWIVIFLALAWLGFSAEGSTPNFPPPGKYILTAQATSGAISGTKASGVMNISSKTLTFYVNMPKGHSPAKIRFKATHGRKPTFIAVATNPTDVGMVMITVKKSNSSSASGTFFHSQGAGNWQIR